VSVFCALRVGIEPRRWPRQTREASARWAVRRSRKRLEFVSAKRAASALQARAATIERTVSNPSANSIVATPHCGACSLEFDLSSDEIPATGGRQSFAHFDSRKRRFSYASGFSGFGRIAGFFRFATSRVAAGQQGTDFNLYKSTSVDFRKFPVFSALKMSTLKIPDRSLR